MKMTKAKFMIVTPTNPKKSSLMIVNNIVSTIAPPPLSISQQIAVVYIKELRWQPTLLILISYGLHYTTFLDKTQANIVKIYN